MTITITPETEERLRQRAAEEGVDLNTLANSLLSAALLENAEDRNTGLSGQGNARPPASPSLPPAEAALLQEINQGLSQVAWDQYHALVKKRRAGTLTPEEHETLIALSDEIEEANTRRIE